MKSFVLLCSLLFTYHSFAIVKLDKIEFEKSKRSGKVILNFDGKLLATPELSFKKNTITVNIPNSKVNQALSRKVSFASSLKDTSIYTEKVNSNTLNLLIKVPFNIEKKKRNVYLTLKNNRVILTMPRVRIKEPARVTPEKIVPVAKKQNIKKEYLDEKYLNTLLDVKGKKKKEVTKAEPIIVKKNSPPIEKRSLISSNKKRNEFSFLNYGGKFMAFLGLVLLLFFGIIKVMKKGFISKGKLGFLHNTETVSVISTTHIAPKKSLMVIKAHNQVFLVSNTDAGIHPISELQDAAGLLKEGEKTISGTNFDSNFDSARIEDGLDDRIKLKEDITQSNKDSSLASYTEVRDKVKFSDFIKTKAKKLKQLQ